MPTGYTYAIEEKPDLTLREYALHCALAFGACIHQRDENGAREPRHRTVEAYYAEAVARAKARLAEAESLTLEQADALAEAEFVAEVASVKKYAAEREEKAKRYRRMRAKVEAWEPPTPAHVELRAFMLQQIRASWDPEREYTPEAPTRVPAAKWLAETKRRVAQDFASVTAALAKEEQRVREANAWIDALVASLPRETP